MLCIRPHALRVYGATSADSARGNTTIGWLAQHAYLGDLQDLRIVLPGNLQVRALTASRQRYQPNDQLLVGAEACRLVPG